jgi:hypothetical protein
VQEAPTPTHPATHTRRTHTQTGQAPGRTHARTQTPRPHTNTRTVREPGLWPSSACTSRMVMRDPGATSATHSRAGVPSDHWNSRARVSPEGSSGGGSGPGRGQGAEDHQTTRRVGAQRGSEGRFISHHNSPAQPSPAHTPTLCKGTSHVARTSADHHTRAATQHARAQTTAHANRHVPKRMHSRVCTRAWTRTHTHVRTPTRCKVHTGARTRAGATHQTGVPGGTLGTCRP